MAQQEANEAFVKLKELLPKGTVKELCKEFDVSIAQAYRILKGMYINIPFLAKATEIALEEKKRLDKVHELMETL